jgi:hypothetical protein
MQSDSSQISSKNSEELEEILDSAHPATKNADDLEGKSVTYTTQ